MTIYLYSFIENQLTETPIEVKEAPKSYIPLSGDHRRIPKSTINNIDPETQELILLEPSSPEAAALFYDFFGTHLAVYSQHIQRLQTKLTILKGI